MKEMQSFRKIIKPTISEINIDYSSKLCLLGSCFSDSISKKLTNTQFQVLSNPFGVAFNPISIANQLLENETRIFEANGIFKSWNYHSILHSKSKSDLENQIKSKKTELRNFVNQSDVIFITFGSAWAYELKNDERIVANCHKEPQDLFSKKQLEATEIVALWEQIFQMYPNKKWVFTVSPVRHWKDGVRENNVSKGILHQVIDSLIKKENVSYFPSYEIVIDELRDYRFYKEDMLHPNELAVSYIWEYFKNTYFSEKEISNVNRVEQLKRNLAHRPFDTESEAFKKFQDSNKLEIEKVNTYIGIKLGIDA